MTLFSESITDSALKKMVFTGFERTNFGLIELRTDGERVLVFTHSGKPWVKEAYTFTVKLVNRNRIVSFELLKIR